jgi:hypothetical protein
VLGTGPSDTTVRRTLELADEPTLAKIARVRARVRAHAWSLIAATPAGFPWLTVAGKLLAGWLVVEVPHGGELVIVEGAGAARYELMNLVDAVVWVQSDMAEAERRGIERDGGDAAAVSFWHLWMAEELPFMAQQRPWTRASVIVAGTPPVPHDPANEVVIAEPDGDHADLA